MGETIKSKYGGSVVRRKNREENKTTKKYRIYFGIEKANSINKIIPLNLWQGVLYPSEEKDEIDLLKELKDLIHDFIERKEKENDQN